MQCFLKISLFDVILCFYKIVCFSVNTSKSIMPSMNLSTGTRIRSTFDFGLVTLAVNGLRPDDSAIYTCKATNLLGEAVSTCTLKVEGNKIHFPSTMLIVDIICVSVFHI